jgi:hypothetical protein
MVYRADDGACGYRWEECLPLLSSCGSTQVRQDLVLERTVAKDAHANGDVPSRNQRQIWLDVAAHNPREEQDVLKCDAADVEETERPGKHECSCSDGIENTVQDADAWEKQ